MVSRVRKMKALYVTMVMAGMSALVVIATTTTKAPRTTKSTTTTARATERPGMNLRGKMLTLSMRSGEISFYPPYYPQLSPWSGHTTRPYTTTTRRPYTTKPPTTTTNPPPLTTTTRRPYTTTRPPWTTAPSPAGVSVCLRYLTDFLQTKYPTIFTLSPSTTPLKLSAVPGFYSLTFDRYGYNSLLLQPSINFRSTNKPDIWNRICVTLDFMKNVAQVFSGSKMSIRKILPTQYVWSGEPVINFSGFDGQVTDVQVWDYPLSSREIFNFMTSGVYYGPYSGSVLTWSSVSYSSRGNLLFEDVYEQPISSRGRGRRPEGEKKKKKTRKFVVVEESRERTSQRL